ncbi:M6 family metalloprotease domain-containing protein [Paenibacillus sp. FSL E2-0151]|uniref:M6 family metalloprotease domain-containing protein n=1 Tax=Paenibacillus sp. FSL E2-0151 TaxID=2921357 RepID=UPI0030EBE0D7
MSYIDGEILTFTQNNNEIKLRVYGDEFYARYESLEGYTAIYDDKLQKFCYASLVNGALTSNGIDITSPPPADLEVHLLENSVVKNGKFNKKYNELISSESNPHENNTNKTLGPNKGLLEGRSLAKGNINGLTVLVDFQDLKSTVTSDDINEMLNGENYKENGNYCSINEYFKIISSNQLDYKNTVIGPITLPNTVEYYKRNLLVKDALDIIINDLNVDLSAVDSTNSKIVDSINFLYAGRTSYEGNLWPHNGNANLNYNGYKIDLYMLTSMGRNKSDLSIGTFCHETGHLLLRFPDMYDYGERDGDNIKSSGIGMYCLMGSGNHLDNGHTPSPVCSYLRELVGWAPNIINLNEINGELSIKHGEYNTICMYSTHSENEYFILENRTNLNLDKYLPSSGLAVYHCDTLGSNELQTGSSNRHYQCALLQADGNSDLENDVNSGDGTDLYSEKDGVVISGSTNPSSRLWNNSDSGLVISDISSPGSVIKLKILNNPN